ncbi:MAG: bifunctional riboflavin kinase/FAD synthetase [Fuerstiella sp.]
MNQFQLQIPDAATQGVVAIGNFDGVHFGHQQMLKQVCSDASRLNGPSVVLTFDPHPVTVLKPGVEIPRLTTIPERIRLLKSHGADHVVILPATAALLEMTAREFFSGVIVSQLEAKGMVEGPDFRFGKNREGDVSMLSHLCRDSGIGLRVIESVESADELVSSTRIRSLISEGDLQQAWSLLGRPYAVCGTVVAGAARGRQLGFPTANLADMALLLPADGVYAGFVRIDSEQFAVAVNIGPNPTFHDGQRKVECHVLDFDGELYGRELSVGLLDRIRGLVQFANADELVSQIDLDIQATRKIYSRFQKS